MSIAIRPIIAKDYDQWASLWHGYLAFYETVLPKEQYKHAFAQLLLNDPASFSGLLAVQNDKAIGLVHFVFHPHMWRSEGVCYLQDLYVDPAARGTGVGRALIEAVYAEADARGVPEVYWMTQEHNQTARRLYDRIGECTPFIKYRRA